MDIHALKATGKSRFDAEYSKWSANQCTGYEWWDSIDDWFKEDMKPFGLDVREIYFSVAYCQGDYASFDAYLDFAKWLEAAGYAEQYPALVVGCRDYDLIVKVNDRRNRPRVDWDYYYQVGSNTDPSGVFEMLDQDAWTELIDSQFDAEDWEQLINDWLESKAKELYKALQEEYEYLTSEEQFIEHCEANDIEFTTEEN